MTSMCLTADCLTGDCLTGVSLACVSLVIVLQFHFFCVFTTLYLCANLVYFPAHPNIQFERNIFKLGIYLSCACYCCYLHDSCL